MERPYILHLFTPGAQMSPFDINMAADAGYQVLAPYCGVTLDGVAALTQDTIFSRSPKGLARTGIFIGGRDALLAADMLERARRALVPPFAVSLMADPSGAYTTAAAMVACVESVLQQHHGSGLAGRRVLVLGGTGPVGRIAAVIAARCGADVALSSHGGQATAASAASATGQRFGVTLGAVSGAGPADLQASIADAEVLLACAAAGVQVVGAADLPAARRLRVVADLNAVPPEGVAGVGVMDDGRPIEGSPAVGIGALAIGNVKYQTQQQLLRLMHEAEKPQVLDFTQAFERARVLRGGSVA
ncbi:methylene-tetrahydromethanopterin dehydrogenase [Sphaerotilus hippei]|uniref:Methylene-tetrahydromethanopterin dehydrogenase n=1 Tax=Sphaerotilus hippei TaxID=744406 RepID=A0A318H5K5_9BURK|nr:NAD(P)-dependent methylenetetrahydromethanopterin dehydrogenase [Sphaerotilus hippei]PXW91961.1 methylene-tetrahydromethanopterin dehydrogenase [Sphaerotilus hippei]